MSRPIIYTSLLLLLATALTLLYFTGRGKTIVAAKKEKILTELASLEAYNQYFQGRNCWNRQDERSIRKGIVFFNRAIRLDPTLSPAYCGLADCYSALGYGSYEQPDSAFLKAETAAQQAIQLDPSLADAYTSLGYVRFYYYRDWAGAEKEFTKALQSDPHYELAFDFYAYYLTAMGRFPEAGIAIEKALQINPLSMRLNVDRGFYLYYSGRYPEAVQSLQSAIEANPKSPLAHLWMGRSFEEMKRYTTAIAEFQSVLSLNRNWPIALAALGHVYGIMGESKKANAVLDTLLRLEHERFVTPYGIALVYASLGDRDNTFKWLEKAYAGRSNWLVWLKLDPRWRNVRDDKRYDELLKRVDLVRETGL